MKKTAILFLLILFSGSVLMAQEIQIKGKVLSSTDQSAMPGVNVILKGTTQGAITNVEGNFSITVPSAESILVFSFIGFQKTEVSVGTQREFNIILKEDAEVLDELVFVGYGKIKKSDLTGAISSVGADKMKDAHNTGLDQALQGRAAGVMVTNNTGAPGSGVSIKVRGIGSIARSNEPLYVIDGIPLDNTQIGNPQTGDSGDKINPMANINPNEIESMEVLKDPASCAIFGSRGANGVVLIHTKRGKSGKPSVEFSTSMGVSKVGRTYDLLNSKDYQRLNYEGLRKMRVPLANPRYIKDWEVEKYDTDWQDKIFTTGSTYDANLTARGGTENATYMISGGYFNNQGVVIGSGFDRYSLRTNLDMNLSKKVRIGTSISVSQSRGQRQRNSVSNASIESNKTTGGPIVMSALTTSPVYPEYDSLGNYGIDNRNKAIANPVMLAKEQSIKYFTNRMLGNFSFTWDIFKGLSFNSLLGADLRNTKENFFWGPYFYADKTQMPGSGRTSDNNHNGLSMVWTNTLTYDKDFGKHHITALAGHEASELTNEGTYAEVGGMPIMGITTFGSSTAKLNSSNYKSASTLESYFGRLNYSFDEKYMVQMNIRKDGSSRFGLENRWGVFPAASFGWNMAKEGFMENVDFISELKPRLSIGKTGNQEIGDYNWRGSFMVGTIPNAYDVDNEVMNYLDLLGGRYDAISDYGYSWEQHTTTNLGIDISFLKNRIYLSADAYQRISDRLLLVVDLPATTGIGGAWNNAGKVTNKGIEFSITTNNTTGAFKWTTEFNFSTNDFKVNNLITDSIQGYQTILIEGESLSFFTYQREEYVDSLTGFVKLIDVNKDGKISYGGGTQDRTITGSPLPKWYGGFTNSFSWKGFDLNIFTQFVYGNQIYNATRQTLEDLQVTAGLSVGVNCTREAFDNRYLDADVVDKDGNILWKRNIHTRYPTTNFAGANIDQREGNSGFIEDGSYFRIKSLTFGYSIPSSLTEKLFVKSARVYFTGNNLFTLTNYTGFDPEVSSITGESIGANLSQGIDGGAYPQCKTYLFGINVSF